MSENGQKPRSLSEAIARLENAGKSASAGLKDDVMRELSNVKGALEDLTPFIEEVKSEKLGKVRSQAEDSVKKNPWLAIGIVGVIAFFLGWLIANNKKRE